MLDVASVVELTVAVAPITASVPTYNFLAIAAPPAIINAPTVLELASVAVGIDNDP